MDVEEQKPGTTSSAGMLDGARYVRIDGAKLTSVAGNSTVNRNTFIVIKQESGIGVRSLITLLVLAFLFYLLL